MAGIKSRSNSKQPLDPAIDPVPVNFPRAALLLRRRYAGVPGSGLFQQAVPVLVSPPPSGASRKTIHLPPSAGRD